MLNLIGTNLATVIVGAIVLSAVAAAVFCMIKDKKARKGSCGCACANCPGAGGCRVE